MNRKNMPLLLTLAAGAVTCIITFIQQYTILQKLISLFVVLIIFYVLGSVLKWTLDYFEAQNEKARQEEGEVIEKESEGLEDVQGETEEEAQESPDME